MRFWGAGSLLIAASLLGQPVAFAGLLRVAPVRVFLDTDTRTSMVELSNPDEAPISVQVDSFAWKQTADGTDEYEPTTEILAFPPIFTIQPGESQLIRIGRMSEVDSEQESTYRIYFTELSRPPGVEDQGASLTMRLRIGVPIFLAPATAQPHRELRIVNSEYDSGGLNVRIQNTGNIHVRISDLYSPELTSVEPVSAMKYILPGASQKFTIPVPNGSLVSTIQATSEEMGIVQFDLDTGLAIIPSEIELASR
jgi:fimbrial chaperone protein